MEEKTYTHQPESNLWARCSVPDFYPENWNRAPGGALCFKEKRGRMKKHRIYLSAACGLRIFLTSSLYPDFLYKLWTISQQNVKPAEKLCVLLLSPGDYADAQQVRNFQIIFNLHKKCGPDPLFLLIFYDYIAIMFSMWYICNEKHARGFKMYLWRHRNYHFIRKEVT